MTNPWTPWSCTECGGEHTIRLLPEGYWSIQLNGDPPVQGCREIDGRWAIFGRFDSDTPERAAFFLERAYKRYCADIMEQE